MTVHFAIDPMIVLGPQLIAFLLSKKMHSCSEMMIDASRVRMINQTLLRISIVQIHILYP